MANDYSKIIKKAVEKYLQEEDWKYEVIDDGIFCTGVRLECKLQNVKMYIIVGQKDIAVLSNSPIGAGKERMLAVAEFIARVNYRLTIGNFDLNFEDGNVRYRSSMYCGDVPPTNNQIGALLYVSARMLDHFGDALVKVIYGFANPSEAIEQVEKDSCDNL